MKDKKIAFATQAVHAGYQPDYTGAVMPPIYATSTYRQHAPGQHTGYEYSRSGNPTRQALEQAIAQLEQGVQGYAFSSGLAASMTVLSLLDKDSHIIAVDDLYGGTYRLFEKVCQRMMGLHVSYVAVNDLAAIEQAITPHTKMIWVETPTNPLLKLVDLAAIQRIAKQHHLISVADNTFASPYLQQPLAQGFDIVLHSATKYINGHSDVVAGLVAVTQASGLAEQLAFLQNSIGGVLDPFSSFLVLRGIRTLAIRMRQHCHNASQLANWLTQQAQVEKVLYPGLTSHPQHQLAKRQMHDFGGIVSVYLHGDDNDVSRVLSRLKWFTLAESLGGVESLVNHPYTMTHASLPLEKRLANGITPQLVRISVGIEQSQDVIDDWQQALQS